MSSIVAKAYRWFEYPHRFVVLPNLPPGARILDVGCGNHSPTLTKKYFPGCEYHGLSNEEWNLDKSDHDLMDAFYQIDLDAVSDLDQLEDAAYDVVLCSHVLEHVSQYERVVEWLAPKLKLGGILYIEVPSTLSLKLPRARHGFFGIRGCWNFYDDPTHTTMVDLQLVAARLRKCGFSVSRIKSRRMWRRILLLPAYAAAGIATRGYVPASVMWDVSGFAKVLIATRR